MSRSYGAHMQWLTDLVACFGAHGAYANASRVLAEEREAAEQIDRFLLRFGHPAGLSHVPVEPPAAEAAQVA